jgi:hypothetical protein
MARLREPTLREQSDAIDRLLGYSQEWLDRVYEGAEEWRKFYESQGPQPSYEVLDSDTESDDDAPLSPPLSDDSNGPDLSTRAWGRRVRADVRRRGILYEESDFYKRRPSWIAPHRPVQLSALASTSSPSTPSSSSPRVSKKQTSLKRRQRPPILIAERLVFESKCQKRATFPR